MNSIYEEIRIALHNIWLKRWLALAVAWGVALLGWLAISAIPNKYESKASVFVQIQGLLPDKLGITPDERRKGVETIQRTLLAADNLEKVVRATDLGRDVATPRQMADRVASLRGNIEVIAQQDNLFEIGAVSGSGGRSNAENAKLAHDVVQKLLDLFLEGNLAGGRVETSQTLKFLDAQLLAREQQLREAEGKRVAFEQKYLGLLPGAGGSLSARAETARQELNQLETNLIAAQSALAAMNGQMASTPPNITTPGSTVAGVSGPAAARAAQLEGQLAEAQARGWTDSHPDMVGLRGQLASARAAARAEGGGGSRNIAGTSTSNPVYTSLRTLQAEKQATVSALSARRAQLQSELVQFAAKQTDEPAIVGEQQRLNRDYEVLKAQYDKLLGDREDVRLRGSVQTDTNPMKFRVIEPPTQPRSPVAPNRPMLLTLVLLAALGAGCGVAFGLSQIRSTYATAGRLERASGLPVIGSVSEYLAQAKRGQATLKLRYFIGSAAALVGAWALLLVVEFIQRSMVA
jgi:polysaccharide biosynthesis transport protein